MAIDSCRLSTRHGMHNVSAIVTVGITYTPNPRDGGSQARACCIQLASQEPNAQLGGQVGSLQSAIVGDERIPFVKCLIIKVHAELVIFLMDRLVLDFIPILNTCDVENAFVVDCDVECAKNLLPVRVLAVNSVYLGGRVSAV